MIKIENISIKYEDDVILNNMSFTLNQGETCAIIGASGCGKTTLLYALAGIVNPYDGKVIINNEEIKGIRKNTGVILQNYGLLPWKTVRENLSLALSVRKEIKDEIESKVTEISKSLKIEDKLNMYPSQLSGGQKQRVAIGRTLIYNPDLLLLDEASSALDAITKESIQDLLIELHKKEKFTLVMVTHSIEEAVFLGEKIVIMGKGKIHNIINNPYFGQSRLSDEFYEMCKQVRRGLEQVNSYEK